MAILEALAPPHIELLVGWNCELFHMVRKCNLRLITKFMGVALECECYKYQSEDSICDVL
jgi:hypothetical protein